MAQQEADYTLVSSNDSAKGISFPLHGCTIIPGGLNEQVLRKQPESPKVSQFIIIIKTKSPNHKYSHHAH
jgi:hypothetical protein